MNGTATAYRTRTTRRSVRHPLRAEALRGFGPLAGAAVALSLVVALAGRARTWQGGWAETADTLHTILLVGIPLAAAAGCWQGGRERRRGTTELWETAARGPLSRLLVSALPVAFWVAAGYLLTVAGALLATWPYARGDHPHPALVPGSTTAMAAAALLGHLVGRLVPTRLAAPLLAMAGYVGLGAATVRSGSLSPLNPAATLADDVLPVWWQPLAMTVWTGGLALAAALAYAARRRTTAVLPLAAAVAAGALLVGTGDGLWHTDPLTRRQVCDTTTTPAVCVNARYARLLPQVRDALSGVTGKLAGVPGLPARWADRPGGPHTDEARLPMLTPLGWHFVRGRLIDPEQFAWEAVTELSGQGDCPYDEEPSDRAHRADDAVEAYLAPGRTRKYVDEIDARGDRAHRTDLRARLAARARLAGMGERERWAWLSAYFAARGRCDTKGVPAL
ncbi:hypothetical protein NX794_27475 [Streptomyces sp. LP11]|uniref:ABC transporter permease n=1 Tax=Streptomyces pyxinicus TaxID=2970331 RepID=A0ABT2B917_9ACTN|nr:hypothetical protein [Streptomyces sp. LP11]MCS0604925.1 hypothetical protein [Streptomyces sp. LP11]